MTTLATRNAKIVREFKIRDYARVDGTTAWSDWRIDVSFDGYVPVQVKGYSTGNISVLPYQIQLDGNTLAVGLCTTANSIETKVQYTSVYVEYEVA